MGSPSSKKRSLDPQCVVLLEVCQTSPPSRSYGGLRERNASICARGPGLCTVIRWSSVMSHREEGAATRSSSPPAPWCPCQLGRPGTEGEDYIEDRVHVQEVKVQDKHCYHGGSHQLSRAALSRARRETPTPSSPTTSLVGSRRSTGAQSTNMRRLPTSQLLAREAGLPRQEEEQMVIHSPNIPNVSNMKGCVV